MASGPLSPQDPRRPPVRRDSFAGFISDALRKGQARQAVKALREKTGLGHEQARDAVEGMGRHVQDPDSGLSPGEVPRRGGRFWAVLLLFLLAALAYFGWRGPA